MKLFKLQDCSKILAALQEKNLILELETRPSMAMHQSGCIMLHLVARSMLFGGRSLQGPQAHLDCGFLYQASGFKQSRAATHQRTGFSIRASSKTHQRHVLRIEVQSDCGLPVKLKPANVKMQPHSHHHDMQVG